MKTLLLACLLVVAIVPAGAQSTPAPTFSDVPRDHWAFEAVQKLADDGIVVDLPETAPNRAQQAANKVQTLLNANATLKKSGIWIAPISTTNKLAVRGVVAGWAQVKWALQLAKQAAPDFEIVNQLGIAKPEVPTVPMDVMMITATIKEALGDQRELEVSQIDVDTDITNRVVHLKGTVRSTAHKALASKIARRELSKLNSADKFTLRNELTISR